MALPAGESVIRFEGVAGGIVPVSAIVTGLPGGVIQKNRDARLLSPAALVAGAYGRRLTLRRTDPATGRVTREPVTLLGGPAGGVVIRTAAGIEALRCAGLPEALEHDDGVPDGLSARPALSVTTRSARAATATVTLSYLAQQFDWGASYVATLRPGGASLDLFAWATLANGNAESFARADARLVAGTLSRVDAASLEQAPPDPALRLDCWPQGTTHDGDEGAPPPPPPPSPPMAAPMMLEAADVVVTAQRRMAGTPVRVTREALGDLKLYRLPERVTVAARGQKQVALLAQADVPVARVYRLEPVTGAGSQPATILLRTRNLAARHLGLPLPAGRVAVMEAGRDRPLLAGEADLRDTAVGEPVEVAVGTSAQVRAARTRLPGGDETVTLTNANPVAVAVEAMLAPPGARVIRADVATTATGGRPMWAVRVPANGAVTLRFRLAAER